MSLPTVLSNTAPIENNAPAEFDPASGEPLGPPIAPVFNPLQTPPPSPEFDSGALLAEIGDTGNVTRSFLEGLFLSYAAKANISPRLQFLYTKRQALDILLASAAPLTDVTTDGTSYKTSQYFANLRVMRANCTEEMELIERRYAGARQPVMTPLQRTTPFLPRRIGVYPVGSSPVYPVGAVPAVPGLLTPDPNDPAYRGDPLIDSLGTPR